MGILSAILRCTTQGVVGIFLVQPVILIQHAGSGYFQRGNTAKQIPQTFEMVLHLTSATHDVASGRIIDTITGTACDIHCL